MEHTSCNCSILSNQCNLVSRIENWILNSKNGFYICWETSIQGSIGTIFFYKDVIFSRCSTSPRTICSASNRMHYDCLIILEVLNRYDDLVKSLYFEGLPYFRIFNVIVNISC